MYDTYSWYNHNLKRHTLIKSLLDIYEILAIFLVLIYSNTNTIVPWCWVYEGGLGIHEESQVQKSFMYQC